MIDTLRDIRAKLSQGVYKNEEHVRLNLVARLLQKLGWDIWNPREVNPEWSVVPTEDVTKVDLALFLHDYEPAVFIEIKAVGRLSGNLATVEKQVRDYNRNNTALFSVITDGQEWRLYYSQTGGEFSQKCFKVVELAHGDLAETESALTTFLSKAEIESGHAEAEAENYLRLNQRQRAMEDCLSAAHRQVKEPPYMSLPECLVERVRQKGFTITRDEAISYISTSGGAAFQTAATVPEVGGSVPAWKGRRVVTDGEPELYTKAAKTQLRVNFPDGTVIAENLASNTFALALKHIGLARVEELGLITSGIPFVGNVRSDKGRSQQYIDGKYIWTHFSNYGKKEMLEKVAKSLKVDLKVEIE